MIKLFMAMQGPMSICKQEAGKFGEDFQDQPQSDVKSYAINPGKHEGPPEK
jgi:hypothetical protein